MATAPDPWMVVSGSEDGIMLICRRPECLITPPHHNAVWWHLNIDMFTTPEKLVEQADRHRATHTESREQ